MKNNLLIMCVFMSFNIYAQSITIQPGTNTDPAMIRIENQASSNKPRSIELPVVNTEERQKMTNIKTGTTVFDKDSRQTFTFLELSSSEKYWVGSNQILQVPNAIFPSPATNNIGFGNAGDLAIFFDQVNGGDFKYFLAVAAPNDAANKGAVFIFKLNGSTTSSYNQVAKITASDGVAGDEFGTSVAMSNGYLVVGAPKHNGARGASYVFKVTAQGPNAFLWTETTKLTRPSAAVNDLFGSDVKIFSYPYYLTGNPAVIAVTSPGDDLTSPAVTDIGSVAVFTENTTNNWVLTQVIKDVSGVNGEGIGMKLDMENFNTIGWAKNTSPTTAKVTTVRNNGSFLYANPSTVNLTEKIFDFDMPQDASSNNITTSFAVGMLNKAQTYNHDNATNTWSLKYTVTPSGFVGTNFGYGVRLNVSGTGLLVRDYQNQFVASYADVGSTQLRLSNRTYFTAFNSNNFPKGCMIFKNGFLFLGDGNSSSTSPGRVFGLNTQFSFD